MSKDWASSTGERGCMSIGAGERTITVSGPSCCRHGPLPLEGYDLVFFVAGDVEALHSARAARFLAATTRELPTLRQGGVAFDLHRRQRHDAGERTRASSTRVSCV